MTEHDLPHRVQVRYLMRQCSRASLSTAMPNSGEAYGSLVTVATDHDGAPLLLLSKLADHTKNLDADPRAALLFDGTAGFANPQAGPRATVMGKLLRDERPGLKERFLARHPHAALYAGFGDFGMFRMAAEKAHFIGGFARAVWLESGLVVETANAHPIAQAEAAICAHMNDDHGEALALYATRLLRQRGRHWRMAAVDGDGCDLARRRKGGDEIVLRLPFPRPCATPDDVRNTLVDLAKEARSRP